MSDAMTLEDIPLGAKARDRVTRYEGTVVKAMLELHGVAQVCIERADSAGLPEEQWFNLARVEIATDSGGLGFRREERS